MTIREATTDDITQIQKVRHSVRENRLSNSNLVTDEDCFAFINIRGKGWVCEMDDKIVGFAIVDFVANNIWALFVHPDKEKQGVGRLLHDTMLDWYFSHTKTIVWLGTSPNTRAETFYRKSGWIETGVHGRDEIKFEMSFDNWTKYKNTRNHTKPASDSLSEV